MIKYLLFTILLLFVIGSNKTESSSSSNVFNEASPMEWFCGNTSKERNASLNILIEGLVGKHLFKSNNPTTDNNEKNNKLSNIFSFDSYNGTHYVSGSIPFLHDVNRCCMDYFTCKIKNNETLDCGYPYYYCLGNTFTNIHNPIYILGYWLEFYKLTVDAYDHYLIIDSLNEDNF